MTYAVLKLTNGFKEIDFLDGVNYSLKSSGWSPSIATRDRGILGGRGFYIDVPESIEINIFNDEQNPAQFMNAIAEITELLDQAEAWSQDEPADPITLKIQLQNSILTEPLCALVVGSSENSPFMTSPASFSDFIMSYEIDGAVITFKRRGQLLSTSEIESVYYGSPSYETNPAVLTINSGLNHLSIPSPTKIFVTNFSSSSPLMGEGFLLMTGVSPASGYGSNFDVFTYDEMTSTEFATQADSANHATGGNVKRIDAASNTSGTLTITVNAEIIGLTVFIKARNNHASTTWRARARSTGFAEIIGRWKIIDASTTNPRAFVLGKLQAISDFHEKIHIDVETDGSVGTLDINVIAILPHDGDTNYIGIKADTYSSASFARNIVIDHRALTHKRPLAYIETAG